MFIKGDKIKCIRGGSGHIKNQIYTFEHYYKYKDKEDQPLVKTRECMMFAYENRFILYGRSNHPKDWM